MTKNEPVAWHYPDGSPDQCTTNKDYAEKAPAWTPMYYKREWVGLTDREMMDAINLDDTPMEMGRKIEARLREKND